VPAEDLGWMVELLGSRTLGGATKRRQGLGLTEADCERAREAAVGALAGGGRLRRTDLLATIGDGGVDTSGQRGYHLLWYLSQTGTLCLGPTDGAGDQLFVHLERWIEAPRRLAPDEAHAELVLRFFAGHGPATVQDLVRWSGTTVRAVRAGLAEVGDRLEAVPVGDTEYLMEPGTPDRLAAAAKEAGGVLLLPGFDEYVLGYADRTAVLPAEHFLKIVPGGNGVFRPTVVHRGRVVGTWRWNGRGARRAVEAEPFTAFPKAVATAVPKAAARLP
jgi:hypothetical protein